MNRRSFFKSLALGGAAAAVAPQIFIPKLEPVRWKVVPPYRAFAIRNPAYEQAMYEVYFINQPALFDEGIPEGSFGIRDRDLRAVVLSNDSLLGVRGNEFKDGKLVPITPWVLVRADGSPL